MLDPFAGSNVTGMVCEDMNRKWICIDVDPTYILASAFRFDGKIQKANIAIPKLKTELRVLKRA